VASTEAERYREQQQQNESSALGTALKVGAVIGAGALGFKYRRQIGTGLRNVGEFASTAAAVGTTSLAKSPLLREKMEDVGTFARALHYAADTRSELSHLKNPQRFEDRFDEALTRSLESRARSQATKLGGEPLQVIEDFKNMRSELKAVNRNVFESQRMGYIEEDLTKSMPEFMKAGLQSQLVNANPQLLKKADRGVISSFTDHLVGATNGTPNSAIKFADDLQRKKFEDTLHDTIQKYETKNSEGFMDPARRKRLRETQSKVKGHIREGYLERNKKRDDFNSRVMKNAGYRRATVEDLAMHKEGNLFAEDGYDKITAVLAKNKNAKGGFVKERMDSKVSKMMDVDPRVRDLEADPNLWINPRGELIDNRWMKRGTDNFLEGVRRDTQVPFLRFNPLDLMHFTAAQGIKDAPKTSFRKMGTIDPALHGAVKEVGHPLAHNADAAVGVLARNYVNTADGKVFDMTTGDLVKEDVFQASARFGMIPRSLSAMANLHTQNYANRSFLGKLFDVGRQETESIPQRMKSTLTKFDDYEWGPNVHDGLVKNIETNGKEGISPESAYKLMYSQLEAKSSHLQDDTVNYINQHVSKAYGDIAVDLTKMNTDEEIMETLGRLSGAIMDKSSNVARVSRDGDLEGLEKQIVQTWNKYAQNPDQFFKNQRIRPNNAPYMPEVLSPLDLAETDLIKKTEDVKRLVHMHASRQLEFSTGMDKKLTVGSLVQEGIDNGVLHKEALSEVRNLEAMTSMRQWWDDVYVNTENKQEALGQFTQRVTNTTDPLSIATKDAMDEMNPFWTMGKGEEPPQYFGPSGTVSVNKGRGYKWAMENYNKQITEGVAPTQALFNSVGTVLGQPFAGRKNNGDVTLATLPFFYFAERLDNAIGQVGLGLSQQNRGSMQSIMANQFARRIMLPYVAYQQAMWLDGMTGDFFSDKAAETYVNMHEDQAHLKEYFGINDIGRQWSRVFQGFDQISESPLGRAAGFMTFGIFGDFRSGEDIQEYYESGEDPIRKGRFWGIGSNTPFTGGKVDRYVPNWYRRVKSDYKFTDTLYGSESEYWANHWMPTLTNPLAPVRHFFLDPYHWENKHAEDRPYPMSGGFSELEQVPVVGALINNTVGRVLKPRREHPDLEKAHRAYIEEMNRNIEAQYEMASAGGYLQGMPAGGFNISQEGSVTEGDVGFGGGLPAGMGLDGISAVGISGDAAAQAVGVGGGGGGASTAREQLAAINAAYTEVGGPSLGATGKNVRSITALEDLRDPDVLADLADIGTMHSVPSTIRDSFYSFSEVAGIYGFSLKTGIGFQESGRGMTLEQSSRMSSYTRAFWDMELGGLGGQLSEIGRRYIPRDPNKSYWNPIRNKMPDWLPGQEYFTDFKHGDPYVKVPNGEMRLPGAAYEKLYKLHPDALGEYGAFDRFRILADVAPYSENYRVYKKIVSAMNQRGLLSEEMNQEYKTIRDQVSERKTKNRFYNRRFDNADVDYEHVTITKMINATTFLTKEYGSSTPIKMAGVTVKADDDETQQWLQQYVHEGARVKVALDSDPLNRVRDDMFGTMRAVVYANKNAEGNPFYTSTRGQNVNFMLANRKSGGLLGTGIGGESKVTVRDDGTAIATRALFSDDMITVGKMWEFMSHDLLPNLPIVGTIADKFYQVRSPLEQYRRTEVYGKAWRPWEDPWGGWLQPMFETIASNHPVVAAAQGAGIGWLVARRGASKFWGTRIGAAAGGGIASARVFLEQGSKLNPLDDNETWIPQRRREEREINDYFDRIKYIKYKGLYERARREAIRKEGIDVEILTEEHSERGKRNKSLRKRLDEEKKWLSMDKKLGYGDKETRDEKLANIREQLASIDLDRPGTELGQYSMLALRYKSEYESTLFGADENGDMTKIFRALPNKDREYFTEFMKAAPKEREEILRLVPKNQRRFYQAKWGMDTDEPESLRSYFSDHYLPDEDWAGWRPDVSIDNYKLKVVKNEGLELTEFNYWGDDEKRAEASNANVMNIESMSSRLDMGRLEKVLRGAGLTEVSVSMDVQHEQEDNRIGLSMDVIRDRSNDIVKEINNNLGGIFG